MIATDHEDDDTGGTDGPKEQFIHHAAGVAGNGSYIDDVICRLKDADTAWDTASDGTLEERLYYCQNWRHDVIALIDSAGEMIEQVRYEAYGTPIGMPLGDVDMDGDVDSSDATQISILIGYEVRCDLDLDGDVDGTDYAICTGNAGARLGRGVLSDDPDTVGNRFGYAGYIFDDKPGFETYHVRFRWYNASLARWLTRDPLEYVDGANLYGYANGSPMIGIDPNGLTICEELNCPPGVGVCICNLGQQPPCICRYISDLKEQYPYLSDELEEYWADCYPWGGEWDYEACIGYCVARMIGETIESIAAARKLYKMWKRGAFDMITDTLQFENCIALCQNEEQEHNVTGGGNPPCFDPWPE